MPFLNTWNIVTIYLNEFLATTAATFYWKNNRGFLFDQLLMYFHYFAIFGCIILLHHI